MTTAKFWVWVAKKQEHTTTSTHINILETQKWTRGEKGWKTEWEEAHKTKPRKNIELASLPGLKKKCARKIFVFKLLMVPFSRKNDMCAVFYNNNHTGILRMLGGLLLCQNVQCVVLLRILLRNWVITYICMLSFCHAVELKFCEG